MGTRTPAQTVGPFFHEALAWRDGARIAPAAEGDAIVLSGRVLDGAGSAVPDAMVEAWQADPPGLGRVLTGPGGEFRLETTMPRGPHPCIEVLVFARGLLKPVLTRAYLAPAGRGSFRWDVRPQGEGETLFFAA